MKIKDILVLKEAEYDLIVYVVAVLPMRRDPEWIKRKLKQRR